MPLYEYQCDTCGRFEKIVKFSDPPLEACPTCGGKIQKLFSSPAIQFKGSGFYITDYPKKSSAESSGQSTSDKSASEKSSSDKSSDAKSSGEKSSGDKSSSESSSSVPAKPAATTSSKD